MISLSIRPVRKKWLSPFCSTYWYYITSLCLGRHVRQEVKRALKLYCGYLYTRPCMINRIWGLKQLWLQVNGHAWFHLHGIPWAVPNRLELKIPKWKYVSPAGFEPMPRHDQWNGALDRSATLVRYHLGYYSLTVSWYMNTNGHVKMHVWNRLCFDSQCKVLWTVIILAKSTLR